MNIASLLLNKYVGGLVVLLAFMGLGGMLGWKARGPQVERAKASQALCEASRDAERAEAARKVAQVELESQRLVQEAEARAAAAKARVVTVTKEVVRYVEASSPALPGAVPWGLVCAQDAAARGDGTQLTAPPCDTPGAYSTFTDADLARVIVVNYGQYHDCAAKLAEWQRWYSELRENWNKSALDTGAK